jgi:hypothetical protein
LLGYGVLASPDGGLAERAGTTVTVNLGTTYQTMNGFGFSQAFGRANDLYNLPTTQVRLTAHRRDGVLTP